LHKQAPGQDGPAPWLRIEPERRFLRRRINRMLHRSSTTLSIELPSFKLTRRLALIERLLHGVTRSLKMRQAEPPANEPGEHP
jgi:hypothetical protein